MYLSRLILDPRNRRARREIAEPYHMHKSLLRGFPENLDRERDRVLFRVETDLRTGVPTVLLQSTLEPAWGWLGDDGAHDYLLPQHLLPPGVDENPHTKTFDLNLVPGQVLAFRLRANPTVKKKVEGKRNGRRVALYREDEQIEWLERKGEQGGFRLVSARVAGRGDVGGRVRRDGKTHKLKLLAVQFDGRLQVLDPTQLRQTVRQGIGSGKGLGFGLLSLARPS